MLRPRSAICLISRSARLKLYAPRIIFYAKIQEGAGFCSPILESKKPLKSYHQFNESKTESQILEDLKNGMTIALISDAGTPGISDPGHALVKACQKEKIPYTLIPGPCSLINALILSGLSTDRFQFSGFLPKKASLLKDMLLQLLQFPGTSICFDSPKRIIKTLELLTRLEKNRTVAIVRELTKIHEECKVGTVEELLHHFKSHLPKGEMILLISGKEISFDFSSLSSEEHVKKLQEEFQMTKQEAIKMVASLRGVSKKDIYF